MLPIANYLRHGLLQPCIIHIFCLHFKLQTTVDVNKTSLYQKQSQNSTFNIDVYPLKLHTNRTVTLQYQECWKQPEH